LFGGFNVALILVLTIGIYLVLMFGLTFWFERYHYYKNRFHTPASSESAQPPAADVDQESDRNSNPESGYRQIRQSEVLERDQG
jgi:hypothetical protein